MPIPLMPLRQAMMHSPAQHVTTAITHAAPRRYAVIGGGIAGLAVSWHLLSHSTPASPIDLHLFDVRGLGAGGSGAAAGLLHPYTARGKVLWRGMEAFGEALQLVEAAVAASSGGGEGPIVWRHGVVRPARTAKQVGALQRSCHG